VTGSCISVSYQDRACGRPGWLPSDGHDEGVGALGSAPTLDVDVRISQPLLGARHRSGVPARADPIPALLPAILRSVTGPTTDRLRVAFTTPAAAQDLPRTVVPRRTVGPTDGSTALGQPAIRWIPRLGCSRSHDHHGVDDG
jgi:hypothetical protein